MAPPLATRGFRLLLGLAWLAGIAAVGWVLVEGGSYYLTPLGERARHQGYWRFKPGGSLGLPLGVVGFALMVALLAYSVRKRVGVLRRLGPLSAWLDAHILCGVLGPLFVVLHSSFKVQGIVALSFWSMVAVALSGVLGRFLYLQIPRTRAGEALSLKEAMAEDAILSQRLQQEFGLAESQLRALEQLSSPAAAPGPLAGFLQLLQDEARSSSSLGRFEQEVRAAVPKELLSRFRQLVKEKARLHRRIALWDRVHELFHYWHVFHKPFAIVMYIFAAVHVMVASFTGYGW